MANVSALEFIKTIISTLWHWCLWYPWFGIIILIILIWLIIAVMQRLNDK